MKAAIRKTVGAVCLGACVAAAPARAARAPKAVELPDPAGVLERVVAGPASAFEGVLSLRGVKGPAKRMTVRCAAGSPSGRSCLREIVDARGSALLVFASDGARERIFDARLNKVWEGPDAAWPPGWVKTAAARYLISVSTGGRIAGRATWKLDLKPKSSVGLERRLWVDREEGLVLRDDLLLPGGAVVAKARYSRVAFGSKAGKASLGFEPPRGAITASRLEPSAADMAAARAGSGLAPRLPSWLPPGYVLEGVDLVLHKDKEIVHYRFSDGVHAVSLFQAPPRTRLDFGAKESRDASVAGRRGFVSWSEDGGMLGWSSGEARFVLVGPLPAEILEAVAESVR